MADGLVNSFGQAITESEWWRDRRIENRKWYTEYKATCFCHVCGENNPCCIEFHHTDERDKELSVANMIAANVQLGYIKYEISKCIPLCCNCHRKLHHGVTLWNIEGAYRTGAKLVSLKGRINGKVML